MSDSFKVSIGKVVDKTRSDTPRILKRYDRFEAFLRVARVSALLEEYPYLEVSYRPESHKKLVDVGLLKVVGVRFRDSTTDILCVRLTSIGKEIMQDVWNVFL